IVESSQSIDVATRHPADPRRPTGIPIDDALSSDSGHAPHDKSGNFPKTSQIGSKTDAANQLRKLRMLFQWIEYGFDVQVDQPVITLFKCGFQPIQRRRMF